MSPRPATEAIDFVSARLIAARVNVVAPEIDR
jgi:hypothetical protein